MYLSVGLLSCTRIRTRTPWETALPSWEPFQGGMQGHQQDVQSLARMAFSPDYVPVGSSAVLVQTHHEGPLLCAPDFDIACLQPVCHSLD